MVQILYLLRVKHYIKNLLIFIPSFFGGVLFDVERLKTGLAGFVAFCLIASSIYIINDYKDLDKDRMHPIKMKRPLASGRISPSIAKTIATCLIFVTMIILYFINIYQASILLGIYFILNIGYSFGLKNIPIVDVVILASGFVIRVFYGGFITGVEVSKWLYLVITTGSLYMGLGKRRNELIKQRGTREVLNLYNIPFLDKNMYVCVALTIVFYSLWTLDMGNNLMIWTVPIFIVLMLCYSFDIERDSDGDPVEVILGDKMLLFIVLGYSLYILISIYFWR